MIMFVKQTKQVGQLRSITDNELAGESPLLARRASVSPAPRRIRVWGGSVPSGRSPGPAAPAVAGGAGSGRGQRAGSAGPRRAARAFGSG